MSDIRHLDMHFSELEWIAFDIEASGPYPLESELCEFAAVKWRGGQVIETYQTLIKPSHVMSDFIIGIHGITNEMVASAPPIGSVISKIHSFLSTGIPIAHHAAFDMGFLAIEFERAGFEFSNTPVVCSSLLTRHILPECPNHKLQTLVEHFQIPKGVAHRALDDAHACLQIFHKSLEAKAKGASLKQIYELQSLPLRWSDFSIKTLAEHDVYWPLVQAIREKRGLEIQYEGGSQAKDKFRPLTPRGIVRGPEGDFLVAQESSGAKPKRFYLKKIRAARLTA